MANRKCYPKPGDLIEIKRPLYEHWALYLGDGYVIHVTAVEKIIQRAESWVNKEWTYGLVKRNCEHFVTMLRYGKSFSYQVWEAFIRGISIISTGTTVGTTVAISAAGAAALVAGLVTTAALGLAAVVTRVARYCKGKVSKKRKNY